MLLHLFIEQSVTMAKAETFMSHTHFHCVYVE